ncbi:hypothetical protein SAMN05444352_106233 [Pseudomonas japonica]|uniref:Uncharacterized protein n=1 Tax=Pseudomonas japonica TaxID=256466 RepID=A0A239DSS8_9PSED|nr:hypothetical protein SAMN05444352_106233 [Pseudomonas japonica]
MLTVDSKTTRQATLVNSSDARSNPAAETSGQAAASAEGIRVNLSLKGLEVARTQQGDADIDESGLPESVRQLLKMIRKLQKELAEANRQLQALMRDRSLDPVEMQKKTAALQARVSALSASLNTVNFGLVRAMSQAELSPDDVGKAMKFLVS